MPGRIVVIAAVLLAGAAPAAGQGVPASPPVPSVPQAAGPGLRLGEIDFGARVSAVAGDAARYQRLRDLRDGASLDRLRYLRDTATWAATAAVRHPGYRDQRYSATATRYGVIKAAFDYSQVPLQYGAETRTPFREEAANVFRLDDARQAAAQGGTATTVFLSDTRAFALASRRDTASARVTYAATRRLDLRAAVTTTAREGAQPWGVSFGQGSAVEVPVRVDHRTNDVAAVAEWSTGRSMARLAYDGSWFNNAVDTLIVDNPTRVTDVATASSSARMALWPDSTAHTVSATGSVALPLRSRALAYVSVGSWLQNETLLPHTINSAITPIPLSRGSADAEARIVAMNYRFTTRPVPAVWLTTQFKLYDYDNRTPHFAADRYVAVDGGVGTSATGGSEPFGYTRHFSDVDLSYAPVRFATIRLGYGSEHDDRTFRFVEETTERTARVAVDSTGLAWGSIRLQYERAVRAGAGFDEEVFSDIGEQVSLRQFDISDRERDRITAVVQVVPTASLGLTGSLGIGRERRPDAAFGLQDNDLTSFTLGLDASLSPAVVLGTSYGYEKYGTLQRSRQASPGPQFDDPRRDWSTTLDEGVHTVTGAIDLPRLTARTGARVAYDWVLSDAAYRFLVPPDSTLAAPQPLRPVRNEIQRAVADVRQALTRQVALGVGYAWDRYRVDDFALSPGTLNSPVLTGFINLLYQWRPYTAHTGYVRLMYRW